MKFFQGYTMVAEGSNVLEFRCIYNIILQFYRCTLLLVVLSYIYIYIFNLVDFLFSFGRGKIRQNPNSRLKGDGSTPRERHTDIFGRAIW